MPPNHLDTQGPWPQAFMTLGRIEAKLDASIRGQDALIQMWMRSAKPNLPQYVLPMAQQGAPPMATPPSSTAGSLAKRFGPRALTWIGEKVVSYILPYVTPVLIVLYAKGTAWLGLLWQALRSGLGL